MKKGPKFLAAVMITAALFFSTTVKAQTVPAKTLDMVISYEAGVPTGAATPYLRFSMGGTGRLQYGITNDFSVTFTSGAYHFFTKTIPGTDTRYASYGIIPIKFGVKEFFVPNIYFGAEAGEGLEVSGSGWGNKKLILSPAAGYANKHWDIGLQYESYLGQNDNYGLFGLRVAYGFGL